jgi:type II secretory pathway pseudopilin PulG
MNAGRQKGFTYLAALITVATMGGALAAAATLYSHAAQRDKEAELLFIGQQYRQAIGSYYERSPGGNKRYPQKLEDMLEDRRFPGVMRHLRRIYADPLGGKEWGLMEAPGGGIMGVFSQSEAQPIKSGNFRKQDETLEDAPRYADWKFFYRPLSPNGLSASQSGNTTK